MPDKKLISFCMAGRNDSYLGNFAYRMRTAVNYLAWSAKRASVLDQIEILITDWNSEKPLHKHMELSPDAASITCFIVVPPNIADKYHHQYQGQQFNSTCAYNTAIRRASGLYVAHIQGDALFSAVSFLNFINILNGVTKLPYDVTKTLLKISRRMVPYQLWETGPGIEELETRIVKLSGKLSYSPDTATDITSGLGGIVASRRLWHLARGYDERISGWGHSDIEFGLRIEQVYPSQELSHYGIWVYDLDPKKELADNVRQQRLNRQIYHSKIEVNSVNWGLGNECLKTKRSSGNLQLNQTAQRKNNSTRKSFQFKSRGELIRNMANKKYCDFLKEHLPFSKVFRMNWKVFYPLIWYGLAFRPDNYLEFGVSNMSGAPIAVLANKCVNIFTVFQLEGECQKNNQLSPLDIFVFLNAVNYKEGRCRFIEGDVNTALDRIDTSSGNKTFFDLVLFQPDLYEDKVPDLLEDIMRHLSSNGAVVVVAGSVGSFRLCWEETKKMYPSCTFVHCFKNEVGIILKSEIENEHGETTEAQEMKILKKAWRPIRKKMTVYIFVRGLGLISGFFRKCLYEPFWQWLVLGLRDVNRYLTKRKSQ